MVGMPTVDQHWPNVGMMLALCPQHWPDVGAGGHWYVGPTSHQWLADGWPNIGMFMGLMKPDTNFQVYPSTAKQEKRLESILSGLV